MTAVENEYFYIYGLVDPRDNIIKYIGKAKNPKWRLSSHISASKYYHTAKDNWLKKLLSLGLKPTIEILWIDNNNDSIEEAEQYFIDLYKKEGHLLKNSTNGGVGSYGRVVGEKTKQKLSEMFKGRSLSEEHKIKISESSKIHWENPEYRKKIINALRNRVHSEESKRKGSLAKLKIRDEYSERMKARMNSEKNHWIGRKHKPETIEKLKIVNTGSTNGNAKLDEFIVKYIRQMRKMGASRKTIFSTFKKDTMPISRIDNILYNDSWRNVA